MKKILNLLAGVTLVASSAAPVIACGSKKGDSNVDLVNGIINDVKNKDIQLPYGKGDYSIDKTNKDTFFKALMAANSGLKASDEQYMTFGPTAGGPGSVGMETTNKTGVSIKVASGDYSKVLTGVQYSVNNKWTKATNVPSTAKFNFAPEQEGSIYYVGTVSSGLWYSTDGTTWTQALADSSVATADATAFKASEVHYPPTKIKTNYYLATSKGLWYSADGKTDWKKATGATAEATAFAAADLVAPPKAHKTGSGSTATTTYYLGAKNGGLWTSTTGTDGWTQQSGATGDIPATANLIAPLTHLGSLYYATGDGGIYESPTLASGTWSQIPSIGTDNAVAAPVQLGTAWFLATTDYGLWRSQDQGASWQIVQGIGRYNLYSAPVQIGNLYFAATTEHGLYWSSDGVKWQAVNNIPQTAAANLVSAPVKFGNVYYEASDNTGIWTSSDGKNWAQNMSTAGTPNPTTGSATAAQFASQVVKVGNTLLAASDGGAKSGLYEITPKTS